MQTQATMVPAPPQVRSSVPAPRSSTDDTHRTGRPTRFGDPVWAVGKLPSELRNGNGYREADGRYTVELGTGESFSVRPGQCLDAIRRHVIFNVICYHRQSGGIAVDVWNLVAGEV